MESIISRRSYRMAASLIEEFLEDSGRHDLHPVEADGLRKIMGQMERRGSREHPADNRSPDPIRRVTRPKPPPRPPTLPPPPRFVAGKDETQKLYRAMREKHKAARAASKALARIKPTRPPNNGIVPPWIGASQWER